MPLRKLSVGVAPRLGCESPALRRSPGAAMARLLAGNYTCWTFSEVPGVAPGRKSRPATAGRCGFGALLLMPIIGYQYLLQIRYVQPQAFQTLMLGERSWLFDLVALVYGLLLVLGSWYIYRLVCATSDRTTSARTFLPISLTVMVLAAIQIFAGRHG